MTINGVSQGYRASMDRGNAAPVLLGQLVPAALNSYGTAVGYRVDPTRGVAVAAYAFGPTVTDIVLPTSLGAVSSRATAVHDNGSVLGVYTDSAGLSHGFVWRAGSTTALPVLGSSPAIPVAVNASGIVAVNGTAGGLPVAAIFSLATGGMSRLVPPSGYVSFTATSMNRWGYVAGIAVTTAGVNRGFVWEPSRGFVALTNYVLGLSVADAVHIDDLNRVLVHGNTRADPTVNPYLLQL
jgi:hypothetical protein